MNEHGSCYVSGLRRSCEIAVRVRAAGWPSHGASCGRARRVGSCGSFGRWRCIRERLYRGRRASIIGRLPGTRHHAGKHLWRASAALDGIGRCCSQQLLLYSGLCQSRWRMDRRALRIWLHNGRNALRGAPFHRGRAESALTAAATLTRNLRPNNLSFEADAAFAALLFTQGVPVAEALSHLRSFTDAASLEAAFFTLPAYFRKIPAAICRSVIEIGLESISAKMRISARRSQLAGCHERSTSSSALSFTTWRVLMTGASRHHAAPGAIASGRSTYS